MKLPLLLALAAMPAPAQVRINEFMASNTRSVPDITDFVYYFAPLKPGSLAHALVRKN